MPLRTLIINCYRRIGQVTVVCLVTWGPFLKGPEKFSHPESRSKISKLMITELFYSRIININRGSLNTRSFRRIHFRGFRETGPRPMNASEAGGDLTLIQTSLLFSLKHNNNLIYATKAVRFVSKRGRLQPRCHSKAMSLSRQLKNDLLNAWE